MAPAPPDALAARLRAAISPVFRPGPSPLNRAPLIPAPLILAPLILAVSGGADSTALMLLAAEAAAADGVALNRLLVATVDHGLRPESAAEAAAVARAAAALQLEHQTLVWQGPKPATGIEEAAREARYGLLTGLAQLRGASAIVTAHTANDQAETVLMRLARGSGLDGLAAMASVSQRAGVPLLRPLLDVTRAELLAYLTLRGAAWIEDPSNADPKVERVRLRQAQAALTAAGLTAAPLAVSARRLGRARAALEQITTDRAGQLGRMDAGGGITLARKAWAAEPAEVRLRLLARAITAVTGDDTPVNLAQLEAVEAALAPPGMPEGPQTGRTLAGALISAGPEHLLVAREPGRGGLPELSLVPGETLTWDRRFAIALAADVAEPVLVRPRRTTDVLGGDVLEGDVLAGASPLPYAVARSVPVVVTAGGVLLAAPAYGRQHPGVTCTLLRRWP